MKFGLIFLVGLFASSLSAQALEIQCEGPGGIAIELTGVNSTAMHFESSEPVVGSLSAPYNFSIEMTGLVEVSGESVEINDTILMLRRGRSIHTQNVPGFSLFWSSPTQTYLGSILDHEVEVECDLDGFE